MTEIDLGLDSDARGRWVITATSQREVALAAEVDDTQEGLFTSAVIEGLTTGSADRDGDGRVSVGDLYDYVRESALVRGQGQTPQLLSKGSGEIFLAKVRRTAPADDSESVAEEVVAEDVVAGSSPLAGAARPDFGDALAGGISEDLVKADEGIPAELDHLGMSTYVGMLATVIARTETPLPLSIGLFGAWGSGKSYFMGLLRDQVKAMAGSASPDYHHDIVQIGFNAWSYADSNLWASLGDEIFRQLAGPTATDADEGRPEELRKELRETLDRARELATAKEEVEVEASRLHTELADARASYTSSLTALATATVRAGTEQGLDTAWAALGLKDEAARVQAVVDETRGAAREVGAIRKAAGHRWARGSILVGIIALAVLLLLPLLADEVRSWVSGASGTALLAAVATFTVVVGRTQSALRTVREVAAGIRIRIAENADDRFSEQVSAVRRSEARQEVLTAQLGEVLARAGELERELVHLDPGQRLYAFLAQRASSGDYTRQLGLISTIRRDFQQLLKLMQEWRKEPNRTARRPIDRIVLYIDDLDRCSPAQVVDVLQAVHLLLALDLFVVVVGVDPRWLLQSLRQEYRRVLTADHVTEEEDGDEASWRSTPSDYLEKIFNIPFVLPAMTTHAYSSLIERLTNPREEREVPKESDPPKVWLDASSGGQERDPGILQAQPGSEVTDTAPAALAAQSAASLPPRPLTKQELDLLYALAPFVGTPREAKRLLNLYRMLRSTQDISDASRFIGTEESPGQYQAVAVLLGLLTGYPLLLGDMLHAAPDARNRVAGGLCTRKSVDMTWSDFLDSLRPREHEGDWRNSLRVRLSVTERAQWAVLLRSAESSRKLVHLPDLDAFRYWGPHVSRFSFLLSTRDASDVST